jgi:hypothetical protein
VKVTAGRLVTLDPATTDARAWFRRYGADSAAFEAMGESPEPRNSPRRNQGGEFQMSHPGEIQRSIDRGR